MPKANRICQTLSLLLALCMALTLLPLTATADTPPEASQGFAVTCSGNVFTITRSGDTSVAVTVRYRTVSLSALEGQNFNGVSGTLTFAAGETSKTVSVTELTPTGMFQYAAGSSTSGYRQYRFEVLDLNGFLLASCNRNFAAAKRVLTHASSGNYDLGNARNGTFYLSGPLTITDDGYNKNPMDWPDKKYMDLSSTTFYDADTQAYLVENRAELRMTLDFLAYEAYDGYQYVQVLTDNTSTCDSGAGDGNPGTIQLSRYMAGFEIKSGSAYTGDYKRFTFPVLSVGNNAGHTNPWGYGTDFPLSKQKFNSATRAADGKILLNTNFNTLVLRFDASGSDKDNWCINNVNAHVTAVDTTAPAVWPNGITIAPGPYNAGNDFYVSVPFTEIVIGSPKLITSWGEVACIGGSSTNVLTFQGTVPADTSTPFSVTGFSGTLPKDLFANALGSTAVEKGFNIRAANPAYALSYDLAGGSVASANPTSYTWDTQDFALNNPTRAGYTFAGWTGSNGDTPETAVTVANHSHGNRTYTANWTRNEYAITYDLDGGALPQGVSNPTGYNVETADFTLNNPTRAGYTFVGWTGTDLTAPALDVFIPTGSIGDRSYIAAWTQNNYTVTAPEVLSGGSVTADKTENVHYGDTVTLTVAPETGYELASLTVNGEDVTSGVSGGEFTFSMPASDVTVSAAFLSEWAALQGRLNAGGTVTMTKDITALASDSCLEIPTGVTVTLDLNGHTLSRALTTATNNSAVIRVAGVMTLTDSSDSGAGVVTGGFNSGSGGGVFVIGGGSFTMTGGTITGNTATYGGGVNVNSGGSFTMTGGAITNNTATSSGGVNMSGSSTFTMTGGTITGNKASLGGGVGVGSNGTFRISGSPVITGNTEGSWASNVRLGSGKTIEVTGALTDRASIGVTMLSSTGVFTSGLSGNGTAANFTSDNSRYDVNLSGGEAALGKTYAVNIADDIEHGTVTADKAFAVGGDTVTLTVTLEAGYALDTLTVTQGETVVTVENDQFIMPDGDVTVTATFTMTWASLNNAMQDGGAFTLPYDVAAVAGDIPLTVPAGVTVTLDLNGHTLNRNLTRSAADGYVILVNGTLTISDSSDPSTGTITGGNSSNFGGGVYVNANGAFTMSGGMISGNSASRHGGGVYITGNGTFTMSGGTISNNNADMYGGGVCVFSTRSSFTMQDGTITGNTAVYGGGVSVFGTFSVSGSPVITGNTKSVNGAANNVYLASSKTITLSSLLSGGASLGVTLSGSAGVFTSGWTDKMGAANPADYFTSDNSGYGVYLPGGEAALVQSYAVSVADDIGNGTVTASRASAAEGDTITLFVFPEAGYELDTLTVTQDETVVTVENDQFTMPAGDVTVTATFTMTWASLDAALQNDCSIVLPYDVTATEADGYLSVPSGVTVTLDLNGHTLDRGLTELISRGYVLLVEGTLTLTDSSNPSTGRITGGNCLGSGGGVFVTGVFTMTGGTITGNTATWGGGVYNNGTFNISGSPVVTGNQYDGSPNNVYLERGRTITLSGPLAEGAALGIRMARDTDPITTGWAAQMGMAAPEGFFTSDNSSSAVYLLNDEAALGNAGDVIIDESITHGTVTADATRVVIGRTVTLTVTPDAGYMLDTLTVKYYGDDVETTPGENNTYTFTVSNRRVNVTATFKALPAFGDPDFTIPAALTTIEESAFEGMPLLHVVDAHGVTAIGKGAFKDTGLTQIKLPKDCQIDETAFDGCGTVYVFAPAGGATELYCDGQDGLVFVAADGE